MSMPGIATSVLVVGGGSGIGAAVAERFARGGHSVAVADIAVDAAEATRAKLTEQFGGRHLAVRLDMSDEASVHEGFGKVEAELGPVRVLPIVGAVYPATRKPPIASATVDGWIKVESVNGRGAFLCIREMLRLREQRRVENARIITFSSIGAQIGAMAADVSYAASKAAVLGLTRTAAKEGAPLGVTANCISPAYIETPMFVSGFTAEQQKDAARQLPVGRLGRPDEVAALVEFLAGPDAAFITGTTIDINGGLRMV